MKLFSLDTTPYQMPESFEECSQTQVSGILSFQVQFKDARSASDRVFLKLGLLQLLANIKAKQLNQLMPYQLQELFRLFSWVFDAKIQAKPFDFFLFKNQLFLLPEPNFANTSAIELAMSNIYYLAFSRQNTFALNSLVATLCRPERNDLKSFRSSKEWNGDPRAEYNSVIADENATAFSNDLDFGTKYAILQYFELMNNAFWKKYEDILGGDEEEQLYKNGEGQITLLMGIGETGAFGDFDKVCRTNVHTIWMHVKDKQLKVEQAEREFERNRHE